MTLRERLHYIRQDTVGLVCLTLAAVTIAACLAGRAYPATPKRKPPQAPPVLNLVTAPKPPQAPAVLEMPGETNAKAKAAHDTEKTVKKAQKTCPCTGSCVCGCNEGEGCPCGSQTTFRGVTVPVTNPQPLTQQYPQALPYQGVPTTQAPTTYYRPSYNAAPAYYGGGSLGGFSGSPGFGGFGGFSRGGGGCST